VQPKDAKPAEDYSAGLPALILFWLFQFHVVARVNLIADHGKQDGRSVLADIQDDTFADHFTRQVVPPIMFRAAAEPVQRILLVLLHWNCLIRCALIAEHPEVVAYFNALL